MSVDGYDLSADVDLPRLTAAALRSEAWILAFFGADRIREHDDEEILPQPPYVAVLPGPVRETRAAGDVLKATVGVRVRAYLQAMPPTTAALTPPAAPTAATDGTGVLTGTRLYAATVYDTAGESCVDDSTGIVMTSAAITYSAQKGKITMPAVGTGQALRLWATKLGGTALYFHSLAASAAVVADNVPDASLSLEMAPIRFLGRRIVSALKRSLVVRERLEVGGTARAFGALGFEDAQTRAENGVRVHEFTALFPLRMDVYTRTSTVEAP